MIWTDSLFIERSCRNGKINGSKDQGNSGIKNEKVYQPRKIPLKQTAETVSSGVFKYSGDKTTEKLKEREKIYCKKCQMIAFEKDLT